MLTKTVLQTIEKEISSVSAIIGFDVAVLMKIEGQHIKVIKIYGDHFARPDIIEDKILDRNLPIYQNENLLTQDNANFSYIPTIGIGADCGFRIRNTPYLITFDDVLSAIEITTETQQKIQIIQEKIEKELQHA